MIARNHTGHRCGQSHPKAVLTDAEVRMMRAMRERDSKTWTYNRLAGVFGCGESTVRDIVRFWVRGGA